MYGYYLFICEARSMSIVTSIGLECGPLQRGIYQHILITGKQWICELNVVAKVKILTHKYGKVCHM